MKKWQGILLAAAAAAAATAATAAAIRGGKKYLESQDIDTENMTVKEKAKILKDAGVTYFGEQAEKVAAKAAARTEDATFAAAEKTAVAGVRAGELIKEAGAKLNERSKEAVEPKEAKEEE